MGESEKAWLGFISFVVLAAIVLLALMSGGGDSGQQQGAGQTPQQETAGDWMLVMFGTPTYDYSSVKRRSFGYTSLESCLGVGHDILSRSTDKQEWFQCGYSCELKYGDYVCNYVCEQTGDCRY